MNNELENWQNSLENEWRDWFSIERTNKMRKWIDRAAMILFIALMVFLTSCVGYEDMHVLPSSKVQEVTK